MLHNTTSVKRHLLACVAALTMFGACNDVRAARFHTLLSFDGNAGGNDAVAGLWRDRSRHLYGTTKDGGDPNCACGVVYQLAHGTETVLHSFTNGGDGNYPIGGVVRDKAGNLYGTTDIGGAKGFGTVFEIAPDGTETLLHSFHFTDGAEPAAGLVRDKSGILYGTTFGGGTHGKGTVFKFAPDAFAVLHDFTGKDGDGAYPSATLIIDPSGNLLGTTVSGGTGKFGGNGTVFKISATGQESIVYAFQGDSDGSGPAAGLILDSSGNLYGTTFGGGTYSLGTAFKITSAGSESVLHSFAGGTDGANPQSALLADSAGNLYGTTPEGGTKDCGCGTVFKIAPDGTETIVYRFRGANDGAKPFAGLIADKKDLFGTTTAAGAKGFGTVFKLTK